MLKWSHVGYHVENEIISELDKAAKRKIIANKYLIINFINEEIWVIIKLNMTSVMCNRDVSMLN